MDEYFILEHVFVLELLDDIQKKTVEIKIK